jgi:hypothetical protein
MVQKEIIQASDQPVSKVNEVLNTWLHSQEDGNWEAFEKCFAKHENVVHIGTDFDEIWSDWKSFETWMKKVFTRWKGQQITAKNTNISISKGGTVAWYSQLIDTCLETKADKTRIEGFRHTGVMEFTNNQWLIVQSHISAPIVENLSIPENNFYRFNKTELFS